MAAKRRKYNTTAMRAHQKNLDRARYRAKAEKRRAFLNRYSRQLIIGITVTVVLAVGAWLLCKALIGPDGSIPNFFGHLQGVQDDWIVANQGTASAPRYYQMGAFSIPEGYTVDPETTMNSDALARTFYCNADDAAAPVQTVYVTGVPGKTAAEMAGSLLAFGLYTEDMQQEGDFGGVKAVWLQGRTSDDENTETAGGEEGGEAPELVNGHRQMTLYADTARGGCVMMYLNSAYSAPAAEIPPEEDFLAAAERIVSHLTVEQ